MEKIGFIGLGIMGTLMAGHLIDGGHEVHLMSRSGVPDELIARGGKACRIAKDVAAAADVIISPWCRTHPMSKPICSANAGLPRD